MNDEQNIISALVTSNGSSYLLADVSKSAVSVDMVKADVNLQHISLEDYKQLVADDATLSNTLYVVSADYVETYGQQIKNVAPGTDLSDAVNLEQLTEVSSRAYDTYTRTETDQKIANAQYFKKYVVQALPPVADADERGIYLVPSDDQQTSNTYDEYVVVGEGSSKAWEKIGAKNIDLSGYKTKQTAKTSPAASSSATAFIDTVSQDENGVITATKKNVQTASTSQAGIVQLNNSLTSTSTTQAATANAVKTVNDKFADYSLTSHVHDQYLTAVPSDYKTYDETKQSLSGDGYATQEQLDTKSSVSVDNELADTNILHVSQEEYNQLVVDDKVLSNVVYVISSDYIEAYGQQIKNVAEPTDLSDAVNKEYVDEKIQEIEQDSGNFLDKRYGGTISGTVEIRTGGSFVAGEGAQAFGENSFAAGENSYAGSRGWYYKAVDTTGKKIYLTDTQRAPSEIKFGSDIGQVTPDSGFTVDSSVIGKRICLVNKNKDDFGSVTVSNVENGTVLVYSGNLVNLSVNVVEGSLDYDDYSVIVSEAPYAGVLDNISKNSFASGRSAIASGRESHAEGRDTFAQGNYSHAEGRNTKALAYVTHAEGIDTFAGLYGTVGSYSHAEGNGVSAIGYASHGEGFKTTASGSTSHAEGNATTASGAGSHTEGYKTIASGDFSHAEGNVVSAVNEYSHAEGNTVLASGIGAHAEGLSSLASGDYSHAEGGFDKSSGGSAIGDGSHAEGMLTHASGIVSHAEGNQTSATASGAHAEGQKSVASGNYSHAEGNATSAIAEYSHTEGNGSIVSGLWSHAEGYQTSAFGNYSHAEGRQTIAGKAKDGSVAATYAAHAEGFGTKAFGVASHTEGYYVEASNDYEHAQGQYNKSNKASGTFGNAGNTLHSIGVGTSESNRMNAVEVMQNGKMFIKDIGGYDGTNPTASSVKDLAAVLSSDLQYTLTTAVGTLSSGSYVYDIADKTITTISINQSTTPVIVRLPTAGNGARDFILRIEISSSAAPTFTFNGVNETIDFDSEDDDWAVMEPGLNLVSFTETKRGGGRSDMNQGGNTMTYCTVTFDIENGLNASKANATFANPSDATRQVEVGQPVGTLPILNYSSTLSFWGWCTTPDYAGQQVTDQTVITNDTTFYAIFTYGGGTVLN